MLKNRLQWSQNNNNSLALHPHHTTPHHTSLNTHSLSPPKGQQWSKVPAEWRWRRTDDGGTWVHTYIHTDIKYIPEEPRGCSGVWKFVEQADPFRPFLRLASLSHSSTDSICIPTTTVAHWRCHSPPHPHPHPHPHKQSKAKQRAKDARRKNRKQQPNGKKERKQPKGKHQSPSSFEH